jgi:hypothetical protein
MAKSFASSLFKMARTVDNVETVASGNPEKIARRAKNVALGRTLAKKGFWKMLFGK